MPPTVTSRDIFVQANGLRHHLVARGAPGSPVVMMVHGFSGQAHNFDVIATRLAATYHVYCLDVRGRGESEWGPADGYHTESYVADLEAVREGLGLERFSLVGTSLGGSITMFYAARFPGHVERAVLNDVGPEVDPAGLLRILQYVGSAPEAFPDMKSAVRYLKETWGPMVEALPEENVAELARYQVRLSDSGVYVWKMDPAVRKPVASPAPPDPWEAYRGIRCPVLVLRGATSDILSEAAALRMLKENSNARLVQVPGVGHAPLLTEPDAVKALEAFLAG